MMIQKAMHQNNFTGNLDKDRIQQYLSLKKQKKLF